MMAGLINRTMAGEGQPEEPGDGPGPDNSAAHEAGESKPYEKSEGSEEDGSGSFTPEQTNALDKFSLAAQKALYDQGGVAEQLAQSMRGQDDVAQAVADFAYNLTSMLDEKSGGMLDDELLAPAASDVLGQVVEVAQAAGAKIASRDVAKATQLMLARFFSENGASPEEVDQFMSAADPEQVAGAIDQRDGQQGA